jgi:hypothetical protein
MDSDTFEKIVTGILIYLCSVPFLFLIGAGSLFYFVAKYRPSSQEIESFLAKLHFPFTIFAQPSGQVADNLAKSSRPSDGFLMRIVFVIPSALVTLGYCMTLVQGVSTGGGVVISMLIFAHIASTIVFWNFGKIFAKKEFLEAVTNTVDQRTSK